MSTHIHHLSDAHLNYNGIHYGKTHLRSEGQEVMAIGRVLKSIPVKMKKKLCSEIVIHMKVLTCKYESLLQP